MNQLFTLSTNQTEGVEKKKLQQKKAIVKALYFNKMLSNSNLSKVVKLSTPKINSLLVEIIAEGIIEELGRGDSSGGRRPSIYGLIEDVFYVVGITINTRNTIISIFNARNEEVGEPNTYEITISKEFSLFQEVKDKFNEILDEHKIDKNKVLAIGLELPGITDQKRGINRTYFPDTPNLNIKLAELFELPVYVNHDSKIRAYTEKHFGLAKGRKNVLIVQADWGLGLGIIINGDLYNGNSGYSGEFGHLPITNNGVLCTCGKQGCLETIASATAVVRLMREKLREGKTSKVLELASNNIEKVDIDKIIEAAKQGDQLAISLFSDIGAWLGKGIAYLIQLFNPELIVIGGKVAEADRFILAPIQQSINIYSNHELNSDTEIQFSHLGRSVGVKGVAAFAVSMLAQEK